MINKKVFVALLLAAMFLMLPLAMAQTTPEQVDALLPEQRVLPGDTTYNIKLFAENVRTAFIRDPDARAERQLLLAERRLSDARAIATSEDPLLTDRERLRRVEMAKSLYDRQLAQATAEAAERERSDILRTVEERAKTHVEVLRVVERQVPDQAKPAIRQVIADAEVRESRARAINQRIESQAPLSREELLVERSAPVSILPVIPETAPREVRLELPAGEAERLRAVRDIRDPLLRQQVERELDFAVATREPTTSRGAPVFSVMVRG